MAVNRASQSLILFFLAVFITTVSGFANLTHLCEEVRLTYLENGTYNDPHDLANLRCGAKFAEDTEPALPINTSLTFCMAHDPGFQPSYKLNQWAGPLFIFLVPALSFALAVNRPKCFHQIDKFVELFFYVRNEEKWTKQAAFVTGCIIIVVYAVIEALLWTVVVFVLAGPLIVSGIYEAAFDHFVLRRIQSTEKKDQARTLSTTYGLAGLLIGTFLYNGISEEAVENVLKDKNEAPVKLDHLLQLVPQFGDTIVGPLIFFLGTFLYVIADTKEHRGDNDLANGLAFGIWYGVIVLAAITCTATVGVTRLKALEPIISVSKQYDDTPGFIWLRYRCIKRWIEFAKKYDFNKSIYPTESELQNLSLFAYVTANLLIGVPCGLAASICYFTPTVGLGCRSLTVLVYAISQGILIFVWLLDTKWQIRPPWSKSERKHRSDALFQTSIWVIISTGIFLALLTAVGGTFMQLVGIYRNCICTAGIKYAFNFAEGIVDLASDTQKNRNSWVFWWNAGIAALAFFSVVLLVASFHELWMIESCNNVIRGLKEQAGNNNTREKTYEKHDEEEQAESMGLLPKSQAMPQISSVDGPDLEEEITSYSHHP